MNQKDEKKSINREEQLEKVLLEGAAAETVQRFGDAAKQHYVAYSGIDNEVGKTLKKGLKSISESKVDSNYNDITRLRSIRSLSIMTSVTDRESSVILILTG